MVRKNKQSKFSDQIQEQMAVNDQMKHLRKMEERAF